LLFSHDVCTKTRLTRYGGYGYAHVLENAVPTLETCGVSREHIDAILRENPARLLRFDEPG
jgi:phosphotriesterase-related protein